MVEKEARGDREERPSHKPDAPASGLCDGPDVKTARLYRPQGWQCWPARKGGGAGMR